MSPSTGPKTPEGKARSRQNAFKHGLTGQLIFLTSEEQAAYQEHCQGYVDFYQPSSHPEQVLVQSIAADYWRLQRGRAIESKLFACDLETNLIADKVPISADGADFSQALTWHASHNALTNLTLYMQRIERSIKNNTQALEALQNQRKAAQRQAEEEVKLLARAQWAEGRDYDPAPDFPPDRGFVFSTEQVRDWVSREDRLKAAAQWQDQGFHPANKPEKPAYKVLQAA